MRCEKWHNVLRHINPLHSRKTSREGYISLQMPTCRQHYHSLARDIGGKAYEISACLHPVRCSSRKLPVNETWRIKVSEDMTGGRLLLIGRRNGVRKYSSKAFCVSLYVDFKNLCTLRQSLYTCFVFRQSHSKCFVLRCKVLHFEKHARKDYCSIPLLFHFFSIRDRI